MDCENWCINQSSLRYKQAISYVSQRSKSCVKTPKKIACKGFPLSTTFPIFITIIHNNNNNNNNDDDDDDDDDDIIALKGSITDCLQSPPCAANCLEHVHSSGPGVIMCKNHVRHIERLSRATCLAPVERRDTSAIYFGRDEIAFSVALYLLAEPLSDEGGEETGDPEKAPDDELQKMPHIKARKFKSQLRLEPALQYW